MRSRKGRGRCKQERKSDKRGRCCSQNREKNVSYRKRRGSCKKGSKTVRESCTREQGSCRTRERSERCKKQERCKTHERSERCKKVRESCMQEQRRCRTREWSVSCKKVQGRSECKQAQESGRRLPPCRVRSILPYRAPGGPER